MIEYDILESATVAGLVALVNVAAESGWAPHGDLMIAGGVFYQTVTRRSTINADGSVMYEAGE